MKITIEEFTQPLDATIINRKDFTFASGAGGGSPVTNILYPQGTMISDGVTVSAPAIPPAGIVTLAQFPLNLAGARKLLILATISGFTFNAPGGNAQFEILLNAGVIESVMNYGVSVFTFQGFIPATVAGVQSVSVKILNGAILTSPMRVTLSAMEFVSI